MFQKIKRIILQAVVLAANIVFLFLTTQISLWLEIVGTVVLSAFTIVSTVLLFFDKEIYYKLNITVQVIALLLVGGTYLLDCFDFFEKVEDIESLRAYIESFGSWAIVIFFLIQFAQVLAAPIPATVTISAGTVLFGFWLGGLISLLAIVSGSLLAFLLGRKFGNKMVAWIVGEENLKKGLKLIKGKDKAVITLMFLFPFFPDDLLCFVAGLTTMSFGYFTVMVIISRIITVATTGGVVTFFLNFITQNPVWGSIVAVLAVAAMLLIFYFGVKNADRIENWFSKTFGKKRKNTDSKQKAEGKDDET